MDGFNDELTEKIRMKFKGIFDEMQKEYRGKFVKIIFWHFGLFGYEPETLEKIGDRFGLSRERIRQIEDELLGVFQEPARKRALEEYYCAL